MRWGVCYHWVTAVIFASMCLLWKSNTKVINTLHCLLTLNKNNNVRFRCCSWSWYVSSYQMLHVLLSDDSVTYDLIYSYSPSETALRASISLCPVGLFTNICIGLAFYVAVLGHHFLLVTALTVHLVLTLLLLSTLKTIFLSSLIDSDGVFSVGMQFARKSPFSAPLKLRPCGTIQIWFTMSPCQKVGLSHITADFINN